MKPLVMKKLCLLTAFMVLTSVGYAAVPGDKIENFTLNDHLGKSHELYSYADKDAIVLLVQGNGCPIARNAIHTYNDLSEKFKDKNVAFMMINSNLQDNQKSIAKEAAEFKINFPILVDDQQAVGVALEFERTADAFVINPKNWKLEYRGALDDRLGYETQKIQSANDYVADALDAVLAGKPVKVTAVEAKGCLVNIPELTGG